VTSSPGYAVDTKVPVVKTKAEIEALCLKHGARAYATMSEENLASIAFEVRGTRLLFRLPLPKPPDTQDSRSRWRGLLLCIKAKFEAVNRGVETFEEAFLSHIMTDDGRTVADHAVPRLKQIVAGNVPLLPPPGPRT